MRLVTYTANPFRPKLGILIDANTVLDVVLARGERPEFSSMLALIEAGPDALQELRQLGAGPAKAQMPLNSVRLLAPIPLPPRLRALSLDPLHLSQATEGRLRLLCQDSSDPEEALRDAMAKLPPMPAPGWYDTPVYWLMDRFCVSGPDDKVVWPHYSQWVDFELEIAAVIGRSGRDVAKDDASNYIFGYTIFNDLSARDAQIAATATGLSITAKGKDFEGSYAMGPCIVTADEIDPNNLEAVLRVNGEEWSRGSTRGQHWTFEDGISYASQSSNLIPGEVFSSSTIANCSGMEVGRQGARGDIVEMEVGGIGILRTVIV